MRRRAQFSWETHWRESYATGRIDLDTFERMIDVALRAERLPRSESKTDRSPKACAERWSDHTARAAANYSMGLRV